jgi:hypothetical protein
MTKEEFITLESILKDQLGAKSLGDIAREDSRFCAAFVFYGSEWWKRRFDGHQWSWVPILQSLGASPDDWSQSRRSACVETGFGLWNINLSFSSGFHYLANIAFHGGLPLKLISEARGAIGRILSRVMRTASGSEDISVLVDWISSLASPLPQAYQREEIYLLLAKISQDIFDLKKTVGLTSSAGAVEKLDLESPGWRERLPITLDDEQTILLINQLVMEAANERREQTVASAFRTVRRIELEGDGKWWLSSSLDLESYLDLEQLKRQFSDADIENEQWLSLSIRRGNSETILGLRRLAGQSRYRIDMRDAGCLGLDAACDQSLVLSTREGKTYHSQLTLGAELDAESPWVFSCDFGEAIEGSFLRQRGGKIPSPEALLCVPRDWQVVSEATSAPEERGFLEEIGRKVLLIRGLTRAIDASGDHFDLLCGHFDDDDVAYDLTGSRVWDLFQSLELAFSGVPKLQKTDIETGARTRTSLSHWRLQNSSWLSSPNSLLGPVKTQYIMHDEVLWKSKLILLPEGFSLDLIGGADPNSGMIVLKNSGICIFATTDTKIKCTTEIHNGSLIADLALEKGADPPEFIECVVSWPRNPESARLRLPFPSRGIVFHSPSGKRLLSGSRVALQELVGIRIVAFSTANGSGSVTIGIDGDIDSVRGVGIKQRLDFGPGMRRIEIRLVDFITDIKRMLSFSGSLDTSLIIEVNIPETSTASLCVTHYTNHIEALEAKSIVGLVAGDFSSCDVSELEFLEVGAIRLDSKGSEPMFLEPVRSEGVHCGFWVFPAEKLDPGPWLVYPSKAQPYSFRPILWPIETSNIKDLVRSQGTLARAVRTIDEPLRQIELAEALVPMVRDFNNPGWEHAEWMSHQTGHLHLAALDLWKSFACSCDAMAALVFRLGTFHDDFIARFVEELPFLWELVSLQDWVFAIRRDFEQCSGITETTRASVIESCVSGRSELISINSIGMVSVLSLARNIAAGQPDDLERLHSEAQHLAPTYREQMFDGPDSEYQKLLRRHLDDQWPDHLFEREIRLVAATQFKGLLGKNSIYYRNTVVNLPILLAIHVMGLVDMEWIPTTDLIAKIRLVRDFDTEWFNSIFSKSIIRCLAYKEDLEFRFQVEESK